MAYSIKKEAIKLHSENLAALEAKQAAIDGEYGNKFAARKAWRAIQTEIGEPGHIHRRPCYVPPEMAVPKRCLPSMCG